MKLILPYPVSANRYWISFYAKHVKRVFTGPTKEAKAYKRDAAQLAKAQGVRVIAEGLVELRVRLVPANRICMDLDNALKVTIDALKGIAYADDNQIWRIHAERDEPDGGHARVEVEILRMQPRELPIFERASA